MTKELASVKVKPSVKTRLDQEQDRIKWSGSGQKISMSELIDDLLDERAIALAANERPIESGLTSKQRELLHVVAEMFRANGGDGPMQQEAAGFVEHAIRLWIRARDQRA